MHEEERKWTFMPRYPKPHIKVGWPEHYMRLWVVVFSNPLYPHTRYTTGQHAQTVKEAWAHLPTMQDFYGIARSVPTRTNRRRAKS